MLASLLIIMYSKMGRSHNNLVNENFGLSRVQTLVRHVHGVNMGLTCLNQHIMNITA